MKPNLSLIWTIAHNTYREIIRERILYGVFLIAALVIGSSFFLATISFDQNARVLQNIGVAAIHLFSVFILIFVTTNSIAKDFDRRALYLLFSKPISRAHYALGKYVGLLLVLLTTLAILGGFYVLCLLAIDRSVTGPVLINLCYSFLEISLVVALAQLFAFFTSPLNATLYSIALYIIGHALPTLKTYTDTNSPTITRGLIDICYYIFPNLEKFDVRGATLYSLSLPASQVIWSIFYGLLYIGIALYLGIVVIRQREV
jgi:ABC-type transport system involved in multi-copper enzyme maturation permease subunit